MVVPTGPVPLSVSESFEAYCRSADAVDVSLRAEQEHAASGFEGQVREAVVQLIAEPSVTLEEVLCKLRAWQMEFCPDDLQLARLETCHHIALSALADLERLLKADPHPRLRDSAYDPRAVAAEFAPDRMSCNCGCEGSPFK